MSGSVDVYIFNLATSPTRYADFHAHITTWPHARCVDAGFSVQKQKDFSSVRPVLTHALEFLRTSILSKRLHVVFPNGTKR